MNTGSFQLS